MAMVALVAVFMLLAATHLAVAVAAKLALLTTVRWKPQVFGHGAYWQKALVARLEMAVVLAV